MPRSRKQKNRTRARKLSQEQSGRTAFGMTPEEYYSKMRRRMRMMNDSGNGSGDPNIDAAIKAPVAQVNMAVVQGLSDALDRARRGEIHGIMLVGASMTDYGSLDSFVFPTPVLGTILIGAGSVCLQKMGAAIAQAQQQVPAGPASRIIRPGARPG